MEKQILNDKNIKFWIDSSDSDFKTMNDLFNTSNYHWALFIGHLVIEKLLKAVFIKNKHEHPPMIHDLRRLCEKCSVDIDDSKLIVLDTITRFNISARYDNYKNNFYHLCTKDFTEKWIINIGELRQWIKSML